MAEILLTRRKTLSNQSIVHLTLRIRDVHRVDLIKETGHISKVRRKKGYREGKKEIEERKEKKCISTTTTCIEQVEGFRKAHTFSWSRTAFIIFCGLSFSCDIFCVLPKTF